MFNKLKEKWDEILLTMKIEYDISDVPFKTWLLPLKLYSLENNVITILVPEQQTGLKYIEKRYMSQFIVTIAEIMDHEFEVRFICSSDVSRINTPPVKEVSVDETNIINAGLNPKYTFDTFVVGENNSFAYAASTAVADSPGDIYNPLFIYGGVGLGKTHLMQSIGNHIIRRNPSMKVMYVTSEIFTNDLVESIRKEKNTSNISFREKYRNVDVLLIDDIQFIIGKEATQDEFFHTFNTLRESKKQIIISSDRPPKDFETLEERLRTRFEWGLTVDISPPNYETRMAILHKKGEIEGYNIDNEILEYIATNVKSNIRELEGSLTKLVAYSRLTHSDINLHFAEELLKDIISPNAHREVTPETIIQTVAEHFQLTVADITSQKRDQKIAKPRQIAMYLCRNMTDVPLQTIGNYMGKRDHTTIGYGADKISESIKNDESLKNTIDILIKKINPS